MRIALAIALLVIAPLRADDVDSEARNVAPNIVSKIEMKQRLGELLPKDLTFQDESGKSVFLGDYFGKGPVVLALVYYECPSLCTMVLNGLFRSLQEVKLERGKEFTVVAVSIDPKETSELAANKKVKYLKTYLHSESESGIHFLVGKQEAITALTKAVGFGYAYDEEKKIYAHPGAITLLTPEGKISSYMFGVDFPAKDLRLSLVGASGNKIGNAIDHFLLYCYKYDPNAGKYGLAVMNALRVAGVATLVLLGGLVGLLVRFQRRRDGYRIEAP